MNVMKKIAIVGSKETDVTLFPRLMGEISKVIKPYLISEVRSNNEEGMGQLANEFFDLMVNVVHYLPWENHNKHLEAAEKKDIYNTIKYEVVEDDNAQDGWFFEWFAGEITKVSKMHPEYSWMPKNRRHLLLRARRAMCILVGYLDLAYDEVDIVFWYSNTDELDEDMRYILKIADFFSIKCIRLTLTE